MNRQRKIGNIRYVSLLLPFLRRPPTVTGAKRAKEKRALAFPFGVSSWGKKRNPQAGDKGSHLTLPTRYTERANCVIDLALGNSTEGHPFFMPAAAVTSSYAASRREKGEEEAAASDRDHAV